MKDEWMVVVGVAVMLTASVNAVFWLFYGQDQAFVSAPWANVAPEELYQRCVAQVNIPDISDIDYDQIQQGYPTEIAAFMNEHPEGANSRAEIIRHVLELRSKQSCLIAKKACLDNPRGDDCRRFAEQYVL